MMGHRRDPFFVEATNYGDPFWRGAYPEFTFHQLPKTEPSSAPPTLFQAPNLKLAPGLYSRRLQGRLQLLRTIDGQRGELESSARVEQYDRFRQSAISLLASPDIRRALDVTTADERTQERYGKNSFGW